MTKSNLLGFPPVPTFMTGETLRSQALKVLEEAAELVESTKRYERTMDDRNASMDELVGAREDLMSEAADVNQALMNFLDMAGECNESLTSSAAQCTMRNVERGRLEIEFVSVEEGRDA